jgi:thioredoxin-like negative regulator of GroEL
MAPRLLAWTLLAGCLAAGPHPAFTQDQGPPTAEIRWRTDYAAALKEAQDRNLPLVIDFGTVNCYWCKKLDESTFRDAKIIRAMNERFVPLRIDGEKEPTLVQLLKITSYPTVVLAAPDKRIIGNMEGFQEADKFHESLQRALVSLTPADWMMRDYQNASKWAAAGDFARAIPLLRTLLEDAKAKPLHPQAGKLLQDIEEKAAERLATARQMHDRGQTGQAIEALTETMRLFPGLETTKTVAATLASMVRTPDGQNQQRIRRARELLTQARDFYQSKDYVPCLDRCEILVSGFGDLPEGQEANKLAIEIKGNPEWLQGACDTLGDRLGVLYLALADSLLKRGDPQRAEFYLHRVIQGFPGSRHAESAQIRLTQLQSLYPRKTETAAP